MTLIYIATRLYSAHCRLQGIDIYNHLKDTGIELFLPYRDSNSLITESTNKSKLIFNLDLEQLSKTNILVGFLDNPLLDSGVGFEIGFCYLKNIPTYLLNSSFNDIQDKANNKIHKIDLIADYVTNILTHTDPTHNNTYEEEQRSIINKLLFTFNSAIKQNNFVPLHFIINTKIDIFIDFCGDKYEWCSIIFEELNKFLQSKGLTFYYRNKEDDARKVINNCLSSRIVLLCGDGVDMDFGSSILQGISYASNKSIILYYSGSYNWYYSNSELLLTRNIMIQESATYISNSINGIKSILNHIFNL